MKDDTHEVEVETGVEVTPEAVEEGQAPAVEAKPTPSPSDSDEEVVVDDEVEVTKAPGEDNVCISCE